MIKVYLSGQINRTNPRTLQRSKEEINLIARRICLGRAVPVAPALWFLGYERDPRLPKEPSWWVENVFKEFMATCDIFCYKPSLTGVKDAVSTLEHELWRTLFPGRPQVSSDVILDFLLSKHAEEVLGGPKGV